MLVVLPEAENRVSPVGETNRSWTTVSELEPLPAGGLEEGRGESAATFTTHNVPKTSFEISRHNPSTII